MQDILEISTSEGFLSEILNAIPSGIFVTDLEQNVLVINQAAAEMIGRRQCDCFDRKCYELFNTPMCGTKDCTCLKSRETKDVNSGQTVLMVGEKEIPIEYASRPLKNIHGDVIGCVEHFIDISERLEKEKIILEQQEKLLKKREEAISHLQDEILKLSTPVIEVWDGVIALPLIGTLDSHRARIAMEWLLEAIERTRAPFVIIDITGVPTVDAEVANHILQTVDAARLMGSEAILTGISPVIARTIAQLGVNMGDITVRGRMTDALHMAISTLREREMKTKRIAELIQEKQGPSNP